MSHHNDGVVRSSSPCVLAKNSTSFFSRVKRSIGSPLLTSIMNRSSENDPRNQPTPEVEANADDDDLQTRLQQRRRNTCRGSFIERVFSIKSSFSRKSSVDVISDGHTRTHTRGSSKSSGHSDVYPPSPSSCFSPTPLLSRTAVATSVHEFGSEGEYSSKQPPFRHNTSASGPSTTSDASTGSDRISDNP